MNNYNPDSYEDEEEERLFKFLGFPGGNIFGPGGSNQGGQFPSSGQTMNPPNIPPPSFTPTQSNIQTFAVDPEAIYSCLYRFT